MKQRKLKNDFKIIVVVVVVADLKKALCCVNKWQELRPMMRKKNLSYFKQRFWKEIVENKFVFILKIVYFWKIKILEPQYKTLLSCKIKLVS